jgi:hypothetical protein
MPGYEGEATYARLVPDGLLYLVLVVVWAFVLIPMWLRKHDEANESRSVDRFSRALSSLSGRRDRKGKSSGSGAWQWARAVVMPGRPAGAQDVQVSVACASAPPDEPRQRPARADRAQRSSQAPEVPLSPAARAARRRRWVLLGLLLVTTAVLVAGLLHRLPRWAVAVPALVTVLFLVSARRQVARREQMRRRRIQRASLSEVAREATAGRTVSTRARRGVRATSARPEPVVAPGIDLAEAADSAPAAAAVGDERGWAAVPTTLPTYVTAPAATRVPRNIDRETPGSWSGAAMLEQARSTRQEEVCEDSGMRVGSFEISVPRSQTQPRQAASSVAGEAVVDAYGTTYRDRYLDTTAGAAELEQTDDEAVLSALLEDPRTGVSPHEAPYHRVAG